MCCVRVPRGFGDTIAKLADPGLEELACKHVPDCKGRKVSRQVFRERAEKCDVCEERVGLRCVEADDLLNVVLSFSFYQCPANKWLALVGPSR